MATYISLLRGINVGGKVLAMSGLRKLCEDLGFKSVQTYIQSGNVLFEASDKSTAALSKLIESQISRQFGMTVSVITLTTSELSAIIKGSPFVKEKGIDQARLHITLLFAKPTKEGLAKLAAIPAAKDRNYVKGTTIYLYCPDGYGRSKLANPQLERALGVTCTTRNWNTMKRLYEMAHA